jgi:general stress protein YciG
MKKKNRAAQALGRLGGKARAKALSADELAQIGRKGGRSRAKNLTAEQRSASARRAVEARIAKYGQQRRKPKDNK